MKRYSIIGLVLIVFSCVSESKQDANIEMEAQKDVRLTGLFFWSEFYHYQNNYFFDTDSTGFIQMGQVAWSIPIVLNDPQIAEDSIIYGGKEAFSYTITDTTLLIYFTESPSDSIHVYDTSLFYVRHHKEGWFDFISDHEYVYGKEVLAPDHIIPLKTRWTNEDNWEK